MQHSVAVHHSAVGIVICQTLRLRGKFAAPRNGIWPESFFFKIFGVQLFGQVCYSCAGIVCDKHAVLALLPMILMLVHEFRGFTEAVFGITSPSFFPQFHEPFTFHSLHCLPFLSCEKKGMPQICIVNFSGSVTHTAVVLPVAVHRHGLPIGDPDHLCNNYHHVKRHGNANLVQDAPLKSYLPSSVVVYVCVSCLMFVCNTIIVKEFC